MKKILLCSICALFLGVSFVANAADTSSTSSVSKVSSVTGTYGKPQESIEAAQKYVKSAFFYSTREGDKVEGKSLTNTSDALKKVKKNRREYYEEVVSAAYAQANEELTTGTEQAKERLTNLTKKAENADTYDDKKAAGALIANASVQERAKRLSLDLALLELEAVVFLNTVPANYVIARSPEQVDAEAAENIKSSTSGKEK